MKWLPDLYCAKCEVLWEGSLNQNCWVCNAQGIKRVTCSTDEEQADYTIQRVLQLHRI